MSTVFLQVEGMNCGSCVKHVTKALNEVPGVNDVAVDLDAGRATVEGSADSSALTAALKDAGYPATVDESAKPA
ncbi:heavy-metal-associated domain-containing protein [Pseudomonas sp. OIL-1]|uniref:CopZ family metallochaperone n=1 Tax=Pseudomonas sp. OIL-1 TaxID=2706126 RepID=UPI0013A78056|nr:heavy metal-associated domain-containing protein [Pseudomonas sp. OIL-1]QIB50299.1 heavy-metal-associated domain-containing protein [Pseudomonas sp. OIL-1]